MAHMTLQEDFARLRDELRSAGCFHYRPWRSAMSLLLHLALSSTALFAASQLPLAPAAILFVLGSFFFYRIGWLMHDAAHSGVFPSSAGNRRFASLTAAILGEFPSGWRYGHNRHHVAPNVLGSDMDQSERWDPARRYRNIITAFIGIVLLTKYKGVYLPKSLLLLGVRDGYFCFKHAPGNFRQELLLSGIGTVLQISFFIMVFGMAGLALFLAHTTIGMIYLNSAFMGNHYDLEFFKPAEAEALDFVELQVLTARNYSGGLWARYIFGGLEHQIEHHLFPSMPRHMFRRAAPRVRQFCCDHGLPYHELPFHDCLRRAVRFHIVRSDGSR